MCAYESEKTCIFEKLNATLAMSESGHDEESMNPAVSNELVLDGCLILIRPWNEDGAPSLENIRRVISGAAPLIMRSLRIDDVSFGVGFGKILFPWFRPTNSPEELHIYNKFIDGLLHMARSKTTIALPRGPIKTDRAALCCLMIRLGFLGDNEASAREQLYMNFGASEPGDTTEEVGVRCVMLGIHQ